MDLEPTPIRPGATLHVVKEEPRWHSQNVSLTARRNPLLLSTPGCFYQSSPTMHQQQPCRHQDNLLPSTYTKNRHVETLTPFFAQNLQQGSSNTSMMAKQNLNDFGNQVACDFASLRINFGNQHHDLSLPSTRNYQLHEQEQLRKHLPHSSGFLTKSRLTWYQQRREEQAASKDPLKPQHVLPSQQNKPAFPLPFLSLPDSFPPLPPMNTTKKNTLLQQSVGDEEETKKKEKRPKKRKVTIRKRGPTVYLDPTDGPYENDIICARGRRFSSTRGSQRFRTIRDQFVAAYVRANTKEAKSVVIDRCIEAVEGESGARFLRYHSHLKRFTIMCAYDVRDKVGHALRVASNGAEELSS